MEPSGWMGTLCGDVVTICGGGIDFGSLKEASVLRSHDPRPLTLPLACHFLQTPHSLEEMLVAEFSAMFWSASIPIEGP
jgi:hypothetical protein